MLFRSLPDLVPHIAALGFMREAFVESIIWRDASSFSRATDRYIKQEVLAYRGTFDDFWNALITLATTPNHPFNADRLHKILSRFKLPVRDEWWSIFLYNEYGKKRAVNRLVEWAWDVGDKPAYDDEVIRLAGITLTWFFTTSNRSLRDRSTKAMVRLCENRIHILEKIIEKFADVNDPYVSERLYAVAYGCAMRTTDDEALAGLSQCVYRLVFESRNPPPHILFRDYARGVIEVALNRGVSLDIDIERITPPYHSDWPSIDIPESDELKEWKEWKEGMPDKQRAKVQLYGSVMGDLLGDSWRNVIGHLDEWSSERINEPHKPTHRELHDQFVASLTDRQKKAWNVYRNVGENVSLYHSLEKVRRKEVFKQDFTEADLKGALRSSELNLLKSLRKNSKKYNLLRNVLADYVAEPHKYYREDNFDTQLARRWIMKKIINMGWTVDRFGEFDRNIYRYSLYARETRQPEGIGKKYQWISYYELLARLSDNFKMHEDKWSGHTAAFQGPWDIAFLRDIDPSNLLQTTNWNVSRPDTNSWWFPIKFNSWENPVDEAKWLKTSAALPSAQDLIEVIRPDDESHWFTFKGFYRWEQPTPVGEERFASKRRQV